MRTRSGGECSRGGQVWLPVRVGSVWVFGQLLLLPGVCRHPRLAKSLNCCLEALRGIFKQKETYGCACASLQPLQKTVGLAEWEFCC